MPEFIKYLNTRIAAGAIVLSSAAGPALAESKNTEFPVQPDQSKTVEDQFDLQGIRKGIIIDLLTNPTIPADVRDKALRDVCDEVKPTKGSQACIIFGLPIVQEFPLNQTSSELNRFIRRKDCTKILSLTDRDENPSSVTLICLQSTVYKN